MQELLDLVNASQYRHFASVDDLVSHLEAIHEKPNRCHDWRNYVDDEIIGLWGRLSLDARIIAFLVAERAAGNEEWD